MNVVRNYGERPSEMESAGTVAASWRTNRAIDDRAAETTRRVWT
jgi:hypothetical protein